MYIRRRVKNLILTLSLLILFSFSMASTRFMSSKIVVFRDEISCPFYLIVTCLAARASLYGFLPNKLVGVTPRPTPRHLPLASGPITLARALSLDANCSDATFDCASSIFCWHFHAIKQNHVKNISNMT